MRSLYPKGGHDDHGLFQLFWPIYKLGSKQDLLQGQPDSLLLSMRNLLISVPA